MKYSRNQLNDIFIEMIKDIEGAELFEEQHKSFLKSELGAFQNQFFIKLDKIQEDES